jgi:hypothetical protein
MTLYAKRIDNKSSFTQNVFKIFTDACGGSADDFANILYGKYTVEDFAYHDDFWYWGVHEYFKSKVIPHKISVYQAGLELSRQDWFSNYINHTDDKELFIYNLWIHDMSKFSANEAFGYATYDFKNPTEGSKKSFEAAWHHHKMNNPHHPEYWLNPNREGKLEPQPMPALYAMEMVADWIGAGKTYGSSIEDWLPNNLSKFKFGGSKSLVMNILKDLGIETWIHEGGFLHTSPEEDIHRLG